MADVIALLQNDSDHLRCQLHQLGHAVDLNATTGDAVGIAYYDSGKVLLRKQPVSKPPLTLDALGGDIRSDAFVASWNRTGANGFREDETPPFRFRNWLFVGKGRLIPGDGLSDVVAALPEFLQRSFGPSHERTPAEGELAFFITLANIHSRGYPLDHLNIEAKVVADALSATLTELDRRAEQKSLPRPETTALVSNGRMIVAVRRGRPLYYGLLEGFTDCPVCGVTQSAGDRDPRVRAHRALKAVVVTTRPRKDGIPWLEVPEAHVLSVDRTFAARITPLAAP